MKSIFENVILSGEFDLADMLRKIKTAWVEGDFSDEDRTALVDLARQHAVPENSYAPLQEQIKKAFEEIAALRKTVEANAIGVREIRSAVEQLGATITPGDPEPTDEWPEYIQPTGAHDAYHTGDRITFNGVHYICLMDNCVWSPLTYPAAWQEQTEPDITTEEITE